MELSKQAKAIKATGKVTDLKAHLTSLVNVGKNATILKSVLCVENAPAWSKRVSDHFWGKVAGLDASKLNRFLNDDSLVDLKAAIVAMQKNATIDAELALVGLQGVTLKGLHKKVVLPNPFYFEQMPVWGELEAANMQRRKMTFGEMEWCRGLTIVGALVEKLYPLVDPEAVEAVEAESMAT